MKTEADLDAIISHLNLPFKVAPLQYFDAVAGYREGRYKLLYAVGGGKTLVSTLIALLHGHKTVVVMPAILLRQWERWLKRARIPEDQIYLHYGPKRNLLENPKARWILTSHAVFRIDIEKFLSHFKKEKVTILFDEAQAIKSVASKLFKATSRLAGADNPFIAMTATPTSKPEDSYAYMKLTTPGLYRSMTHWEALHVKERDFFGGIKSYTNLELLRDNFALKTAKRDKKELFGYSDDMSPILTPVEYDLAPKHLSLYKKLMDEQLLLLPSGDKVDGTTSQKLRHLLQQMVWSPEKFSGDDSDVAAGFELLAQLCEEVDFMPESKSKLVVWSYYRSTSEAIFKWLSEKYGKTGVLAYGGGDAAKAVEEIMFNPKVRWMVANAGSVGAGLELQHVCHEMVFCEMPTTPIPVRQCIGRVDRPGQKTRPTIRFMQALNTVQVTLFKDLLRNDEMAAKIERTRTSLRQELLGG